MTHDKAFSISMAALCVKWGNLFLYPEHENTKSCGNGNKNK